MYLFMKPMDFPVLKKFKLQDIKTSSTQELKDVHEKCCHISAVFAYSTSHDDSGNNQNSKLIQHFVRVYASICFFCSAKC